MDVYVSSLPMIVRDYPVESISVFTNEEPGICWLQAYLSALFLSWNLSSIALNNIFIISNGKLIGTKYPSEFKCVQYIMYRDDNNTLHPDLKPYFNHDPSVSILTLANKLRLGIYIIMESARQLLNIFYDRVLNHSVITQESFDNQKIIQKAQATYLSIIINNLNLSGLISIDPASAGGKISESFETFLFAYDLDKNIKTKLMLLDEHETFPIDISREDSLIFNFDEHAVALFKLNPDSYCYYDNNIDINNPESTDREVIPCQLIQTIDDLMNYECFKNACGESGQYGDITYTISMRLISDVGSSIPNEQSVLPIANPTNYNELELLYNFIRDLLVEFTELLEIKNFNSFLINLFTICMNNFKWMDYSFLDMPPSEYKKQIAAILLTFTSQVPVDNAKYDLKMKENTDLKSVLTKLIKPNILQFVTLIIYILKINQITPTENILIKTFELTIPIVNYMKDNIPIYTNFDNIKHQYTLDLDNPKSTTDKKSSPTSNPSYYKKYVKYKQKYQNLKLIIHSLNSNKD
jgi:hypothetical protein